MARSDVPFEVGTKVAEEMYFVNASGNYEKHCPDKGLVVAGYTYWGTGLSVLTVDPDGNEREWMHGAGLKSLPC